MSRFLLVVPPLVGHINPAVGVAAELTARGHQVAWAGHPEPLVRLAGPAARVFPCAVTESVARPADLVGPAAFQLLWERFFIPLADQMAPGVAAAIAEFAPDVVLADQQALAGSLVAERLGVPYLTSATTSAELIDPLASMPKVAAWVTDQLHALRERIGDPECDDDPRFAPEGVLAFTTRELLGDLDLPDSVHLVGPAIAPRPGEPLPEGLLVPGRKRVLVSLGTANVEAGARFLAVAVAALAGLNSSDVQGIVLDPGHTLGAVPDNVVVREHVPQLDLLPHLDAVVCHGGHNTVCESLWNGVPLGVAPIRDDQPIVARQVTDAGAGLRVRFGRVTAPKLAESIDTVLTDPAYRNAAATIARSFRAAGGVTAAATHLEHKTLTGLPS